MTTDPVQEARERLGPLLQFEEDIEAFAAAIRREEAARALPVLRAVEWARRENQTGGWEPVCPFCYGTEACASHAETCPLAAEITRLEALRGGCRRCGDEQERHPSPEMVRFEWAETARPDGWWYYRAADLSGESMLRRDHPFEALASSQPSQQRYGESVRDE